MERIIIEVEELNISDYGLFRLKIRSQKDIFVLKYDFLAYQKTENFTKI